MVRTDRPRRFLFEHKSEPLLSRPAFFGRILRMSAAAMGLVVLGLSVGALGYRMTEGWSWLDATLNAAMILTGMGPVQELRTASGKIFAIVYALWSGVAFLSVIALILAPIAHRLLHAFHLEGNAPRHSKPLAG